MAQKTTLGPDSTVLGNEARHRLNSLIDQLDKKAADIIRMRFGLTDGRQYKLSDVGAKYGVSPERIRQLQRLALQDLRRLADPDLAS